MAFKKNQKRRIIKKKPISDRCIFCDSKKEPSYKDIEEIGRFVTDRARIVDRERSGLCARHQRKLSTSIKQARHLALLPFQAKA